MYRPVVSRLQFFIVHLNPNGIDHISNRAWKSCIKMLHSMVIKSTFNTVLLLFSVVSGQARVVRASTASGSGIHLIHGLSSSDSDDDEGYDDDFDFRRGNVPVPPSTNIKLVKIFKYAY